MSERRKLIEVALPLEAINREAAREKSIRHGHPSTLHLWWARRPLAACRAVLFASLVDDPDEPNAPPEYLEALSKLPGRGNRREKLFRFIGELVKWDNSDDEVIIGTAQRLIGACSGSRPPAPPDTDDLPFLLSFAYEWDAYSRYNGLGELADAVQPLLKKHEKSGKWVGTLAELRNCLFYLQRLHHNAEQPPGGGADDIRAVMWDLYHAIRSRWDETEPDLPGVLDPFCGGGSIPLEAQRLGLKAYASDLNPVAVLITRALIEIPSKFAGMAPVRPVEGEDRLDGTEQKCWSRAEGLAEDVRYYGQWMRNEAEKRIGHLYPNAPKGQTVVAWLWARTAKCPNPACGGQMPLVRSFDLCTKKGHEIHVQPVPDRERKTVTFKVRKGKARIERTVESHAVHCLICGNTSPLKAVRDAVTATGPSALGAVPLAVVAGGADRGYYSGEDMAVEIERPDWLDGFALPEKLTGGAVMSWGFTSFAELFAPRQMVALTTFSDLVAEVRDRVRLDAIAARMEADGVGIEAGGTGADAYADAVATYLAFAVDKAADYWSTLATWAGDFVRGTFARQGLAMTWDYAEPNPFGSTSGNWLACCDWVCRVLDRLPCLTPGSVVQRDAAAPPTAVPSVVVSTDPPYYDNIAYADLSDFFYVWLRRSLSNVHPLLFSTMLTPKQQELIAAPHRFAGGRAAAQSFFEDGLRKAFAQMQGLQDTAYPMTVYYAFKQSEADSEGDGTLVASTGWETMLSGLLQAGFAIVGTWPMRTERGVRMVGIGTNALASSIVLVCRPRAENAPLATRREFTALLRRELPHALEELTLGGIAPVDLAQASIGPGMAVFSRFSKVLEADGSPMTVRTALQIINQELDAYLASQDMDLDQESRFCVDWFTQYGMNEGKFGEADVLARAKNTAVDALVQAGVAEAKRGKVRLLRRDELDEEWDPATDRKLTNWECAQHLIRALDQGGEDRAARLVAQMGSGLSETARGLAYRLYLICDRNNWADQALAYNNLIVSWSAIQERAPHVGPSEQGRLF